MRGFKVQVVILLTVFASCATYYEVNQEFNYEFEKGELNAANQTLAKKSKKLEKSKNRLLYYLNRGVVLSMLGEYEESNRYLEKAYLYTEDYQTNYVNEAVSMLSNPNFVAYKGENHENLMMLYYKAMNYLRMGQYDNALVECKRLNIRLDQLSDKYKSDKKYQKDAFIHTLMGIIYDAQHDYNNAFIAYRNALEIYKNDYADMFGVSVPDQLKEDILRTAYLTGFQQEYDLYKKEFGMENYKYQRTDGGDLVFFWHNGLGPVKTEWSINFAVVKGQGGVVNFTNDEYGFNFPFPVSYDKETGKSGLEDLEFFRVAFPKYKERPTVYSAANLSVNGNQYPLELAEDVNAIAFKSLKDRMLKEFGKALLRVALKKAAEEAARNEKDGLGAAVSLFNAITEKADTRNWQTLPHSIYYTRVPLKKGEQHITLEMKGNKGDQKEEFVYNVKSGETIFQTFSSLDYAVKLYP
ncbi:hypothetical protein LVD15_21850 [Fulvivirga maritima]|uniref:COG3014 family protein n=1 Tax=Fulvivirga maritima TaxID=2904247 RepID=UPI001F38FCD7|nr:hypothetical protein [Fulvivirga maritima]UII25917.1 hypothetical protein LVD15_21850 [Fulvivirga maritima]